MLETGQILQERYQIKQKLGQNAGRQTWLAEDISTEAAEPVIVKLLAFGDQVQWEDLKLFEREADILKQLNHPRIPQYRDYFSIDDRILWFGLVQQYIPGKSLKELLTEGRKFSEKAVRKIAIDVLQILTYLHELSPTVLHRDIKPSNLILGQDDQIYLVDFGAVQDKAATEGATFTVVGTYGYAPMEQFGGRAVPASDLYALGATLIHLLTGTAPADLPQKNLRIQFSDRVNISPQIVRWVDTLTNPDIEQRYSTARQALEALHCNLISHPSLALDKPYGSRIQLNKSAYKLEIKVPPRGIRFSDTFLIFFIVMWYGMITPVSVATFNPFIWIFWLAGLMPLSMFIFTAFGGITLKFNRDYFIIQWKLLGLRYRQLEGKTSAIQNVGITDTSMSINDRPLIAAKIQAGAKEYQFGAFAPELAEGEKNWLVQEIKNWVGMK
jgi:serine/threonine protein kinase